MELPSFFSWWWFCQVGWLLCSFVLVDLLYWGGFFLVCVGFSFFGGRCRGGAIVLVISGVIEFLLVVGATVSISLLGMMIWGFS